MIMTIQKKNFHILHNDREDEIEEYQKNMEENPGYSAELLRQHKSVFFPHISEIGNGIR